VHGASAKAAAAAAAAAASSALTVAPSPLHPPPPPTDDCSLADGSVGPLGSTSAAGTVVDGAGLGGGGAAVVVFGGRTLAHGLDDTCMVCAQVTNTKRALAWFALR
jgi:hypothetical protein